MIWNIWNKPPKISYVADMCPLERILSDGKTTLTKDGVLSRVYEVHGKDYTGMNESERVGLHERRLQFFEGIGDHLKLTTISHRFLLGRDIKNESHGNRVSDEIAQRWAGNFEKSFRTRHFVQLSTKSGDLLEKTAGRVVDSGAPNNNEERLNLLDEVGRKLIKELGAYRPQELENDGLASYWAWLLNGRSVSQHLPKSKVFNDVLSGTDLLWPDRKNHQIYRTHKDSYSAWITIKAYPGDTGDKMLDHLFEVNREFSLVQHFELMTKTKALNYIEDKIKFSASFTKAGGIILGELNDIYALVEADELKLCQHGYALQVYADSEKELLNSTGDIQAAIDSWGTRTKRENKLQEPLFWSQFPGLETLQVRQREITTDNFTQFVSWPSIGEGMDSCSWGNHPTALFKTTTNSEFAFTFHETTEKEALGNTLILGGPGSGKTTLISFLQTNALKYTGMRIVNFDRLHGMEVATRMQDGHYEDFNDKIELNPFQMEDNNTNRVFLQNWLQLLSGKKDDESIERLNMAIDMVYNLPKKARSLGEMEAAFGTGDSDSLYGAMKKWLPDGAFDHYFCNAKDSLSFDKRMVTFDMTTQLDSPNVLAPTIDYIFHRLEQTIIADPTPFCVFIDEVRSYMDTDFLPKLKKSKQEYRKLDGVVISAAQRAGHVLDHPNAKDIMSNFATYLLYGDTSADPKHYKDDLGLSESEFQWIKKGGEPRKVLMKRANTGEVAILDVDLESLGKYVRVYASGAKSVSAMNKLRRKSRNWKEDYLNA